ncbi:hypothetical protein BDA96_05G097400 [Sorghum bicolor]|uniref:FLZ-type domain-containing protein n=1 Tax=Sorghum bicolor TaxID=4558 RepID=A0A921QZ06_SORBI|nr:hypothetical protein BDA96_05G097400 [Sorghum bicolor]
MEDYHFHCFQASWVTDPFLTAGHSVHGASHMLSAPSSQWPRHAPHDNDATAGERGHHFLDACGRCGRLIGRNKDIFMYRGDTPFCSEECRQQEMDADEAMERRRSSKQQPAAAAAAAAKRGWEQHRQSSDTQTIQVWALSIVS